LHKLHNALRSDVWVHDQAEGEYLRQLFPGNPSGLVRLRMRGVAFPLKSASYCSAVHSNPTAWWFKGNFSAALLAGGRSIRMGQDKGEIAIYWEGESIPLRVRQLRILKSLEPEELLYSGPTRVEGLPDAKIILDQWSDAGPLSGIASCLEQTTSDLLLCLAVDVARIEALILLKLLRKCHAGQGIVPRIGEHYEPLVAVYPKRALRLAISQIAERQLRLQDFVRRLLSEHLVTEYSVSDEEIPFFANWNTPADIDR
jgi:molybdopterin-guanine dinucleotide biosynthesis protein A